MKSFITNNALSLVFLLFFLVTFLPQIYFGMEEYNGELQEYGVAEVTLMDYLTTGHFLEATFENWESEFLQMALFVWLTIYLKQKGSSESKKFDGTDEVDRNPDPLRPGAPWPVTKGGIWLALFKHSLTIVLLLLFAASLLLHLYGSYIEFNHTEVLEGRTAVSFKDFLRESKFYFESFQNWQSEFLSVFAIVALSIYLRQIGSSQSKPVDAPHDETGE